MLIQECPRLINRKTEISNCELISQAALTDVLTTFCFINALAFDRTIAFMLDLSHCAQTFVATCLKKV